MALPLWIVVRFWGWRCMKRATSIAWYTVSAQYMWPTDVIIIIAIITFIWRTIYVWGIIGIQ